MKFLVLGGGTQGTAAAFDLLSDATVAEVVIADLASGSLPSCLRPHAGERLRLVEADASDEPAVANLMEGMTGVLCALPYYFNLAPHYDATVMPRLVSDRGVMLGAEFRYLAERSMNTVNLSWLGNDRLFDPELTAIPGSGSPPTENR